MLSDLRDRFTAIEDSTPVPRLRAGLRQATWGERANTGGDDYRPSQKAVRLSYKNEVVVVLLERGDVLVEMGLEVELLRLLLERLDQIFGQNLRESAHVEDVFLGVERRELAAELGKGIDDLGGRATHSGIKRGEQPRRTAADDRDVGDRVRHLSRNI